MQVLTRESRNDRIAAAEGFAVAALGWVLVAGLGYVYRELTRLLRPQLANPLRIGDVTLEERTVGSIIALVLLYCGIFVVATVLLLCLTGSARSAEAPDEDAHLVTCATAVAATLNNIGPGLSGVGATENYGWMPAGAKVLLILCMLMGRLEVYAVIVVCLPLAWRK